MSMSIRDLIDELESLASEYGDDAEVRLAQQPSWALEYSISRVEAVQVSEDGDMVPCPVCVEGDTIGSDCGICGGEGAVPADDAPAIVYISEGEQLGYLPGVVSQAFGWR